METKLLNKKLQKLATYHTDITKKKRLGINKIHKLRVQIREILSCISKENRFYNKLKKVIKITNEIRDIDVFQSEFLQKLPMQLKKHIDFDLIEAHLANIRALNCKKLEEYILTLEIPSELIPKKVVEEGSNDFIQKMELKKFSQKELHKYRIYIKKELYFYKAFYPQKKQKIKSLSKIKDYLGIINDNFNAEKRIITFISMNETELLSYIKKENQSYIEKLIELKTTLEI